MQWSGLYQSGINEDIYSIYTIHNKMLSVRIFDRTNLSGISKQIEKAAKQGVEAATQEGVEFIKNEVILGGSYIGHQYYPDVKPVTKRIKAKHGKTHVLVDTSNFLSSWDGKVRNMEGVISGGGGVGYAKDLYAMGWQIDKLYMDVHAKESEKIITKAIEKAV